MDIAFLIGGSTPKRSDWDDMKSCCWPGIKNCSGLEFAITRLKRRDTTCN